MVLVGDILLEEFKFIVNEIEDDLLQFFLILLVIVCVFIDEIGIEVKFEMLRMYNLMIFDVVSVIN